MFTPHGEAFGENFELPNQTAYNETCAVIAQALLNHRMFLLHGDGKYIDVLDGDPLLGGQGCGEAAGVTERHVDRFHAQRCLALQIGP